MQVQFGTASHVGMKRGNNEDGLVVLPRSALFCVADGMGGHADGERASRLAVETLAQFFQATDGVAPDEWPLAADPSRTDAENRLGLAVSWANGRVFQTNSADPENPTNMGTTVAALYLHGGKAVTAHVGDSRVYLSRNGTLIQLTEDHTLVNQFLKKGKIKPEEVDTFPQKNVLTRSVGTKAQVEVDVGSHDAEPGDIFLICSDGLWGMVNAEMIGSVLARADNLDRAAQQLVDFANSFGGTDNVTAVLARLVSW